MSGIMTDQELRKSRLTFYEHDLDKIDRVMEEFLKLSKARCALLVDKDGHMITRVGGDARINQDTISALVAGSFGATKEMAKILGEEEFTALFHQGASDNIQLSLVGNRTILTVIFDDSTAVLSSFIRRWRQVHNLAFDAPTMSSTCGSRRILSRSVTAYPRFSA